MSRAHIAGLTLGLYEKALPSTIGWRERLDMAAAAGFDFVEMSLDPTPERLSRLNWSAAQRRDLRLAVEDSGVSVLTMCLSAHRNYPLGSANADIRRHGLDILHAALELAADVGIRIVQIAGYDALPEEPSTDDTRQRYVDGLAHGIRWAGEHAVLMGLENQEAGYIDSPRTAVKIIQQIDSPYLKLYMDIGNLIVNGCDVPREIAAARGHLIGVHVKDARFGVPRRVPFGEGAVPFAEVFHLLAGMRFAGPMMIEMWNDNSADSVAISSAAREWVQGKLIEVGFG